jgi:hypothetical protein
VTGKSFTIKVPKIFAIPALLLVVYPIYFVAWVILLTASVVIASYRYVTE